MYGYKTSREASDLHIEGLTRDVAFNRKSFDMEEHVSPFDNQTVQVGTDGIEVVLVQGIEEESFRRTLSAATRATIGIEITPRWTPCVMGGGLCTNAAHTEHRSAETDAHDFRYEALVDPLADNRDWEEMLRGGLQTALESQVIVFAVRGASRTCTHQLVRSRRAAFHQQSQRASTMGDWPEFRMPESVWVKPNVRSAWLEALVAAHEAYQLAIDYDVSFQDARFILPEGTTNFIMLEYPVREFLNVYAYRACSMFQWEITAVMRKCREVLVEKHPWLKPYIKISCQDAQCITCAGKGKLRPDGEHSEWPRCPDCKGTGMTGTKCTFQGWESPEDQCDFSWGKDENRVFKPKFHRITRQEA